MEIEFLSDCKDKVEDVADMIYKEFVKTSSSEMTYEDVIKFFSSVKSDSLPITLIAMEEEGCLGTVSIFENDLKVRPDYKPWLASLYVKPEYRSRSVGRKLMKKVIDVTGDLGFEYLYLRTEDAAEYYLSLGWEYVESAMDENSEETHVFKVRC
ncbi:GNAT family N-acetyltransferase [Salinicoccus sp. YB14-2]|uniref:GNAT family N-acetyltransferase n=1 Tax=Salinicoccus sp. YB14-2 TaxID=1572701 RepID=UPI00068FCA90|nr:GNAT family N-acetyltransferase [Salinicoccus sp. YB14-2]